MMQIFTLFAIFIAIFLFGMTLLRQGLFFLQQNKVNNVIYKMVDHPLKGVLIGIIVTAILQSSSAVMIILVGLVSTGFLTFRNSIGIILGANIGTVVTLEIIAFQLSWLIFPCLIAGLLLLFTRKKVLFSIGCLLFGFSNILIAVDGFASLAQPLSNITTVYHWLLTTNQYHSLAVVGGVVLSGIIQSSTAVIAIAMSFMNESILTLPTGISIMLGANIGTCGTALLASIGGNNESKQVAFAHVWINVIGFAIFFPFINIFSMFVEGLTTIPSFQLAHATLIFNVVSTLFFLPIINWFASFVQGIHGGS